MSLRHSRASQPTPRASPSVPLPEGSGRRWLRYLRFAGDRALLEPLAPPSPSQGEGPGERRAGGALEISINFSVSDPELLRKYATSHSGEDTP